MQTNTALLFKFPFRNGQWDCGAYISTAKDCSGGSWDCSQRQIDRTLSFSSSLRSLIIATKTKSVQIQSIIFKNWTNSGVIENKSTYCWFHSLCVWRPVGVNHSLHWIYLVFCLNWIRFYHTQFCNDLNDLFKTFLQLRANKFSNSETLHSFWIHGKRRGNDSIVFVWLPDFELFLAFQYTNIRVKRKDINNRIKNHFFLKLYYSFVEQNFMGN